MKIKFRNHITRTVSGISVLSFVLAAGCNTPMDRDLTANYPSDPDELFDRHVLMVVLDGASGKAVQKAYNEKRTPALKGMFYNAMYTFEGLMDFTYELSEVTVDRGWANLFTGSVGTGVGIEGATIDDNATPSFLNRIKTALPTTGISLNASDSRFYSAFSADATSGGLRGDDAAVSAAVAAELSDVSVSVPRVVVAQLSGVREAGEASGFFDVDYNATPQVVDAVSEADARIGEIMTALCARPDYLDENWMVIVVSSYGGTVDGDFGTEYFEDPRRNIFCMLYNPRLDTKLYTKPADDELPYTFFSPIFGGRTVSITGTPYSALSAEVRDVSLFNMDMGNTKDNNYTVQFSVYDPYPKVGIQSGTTTSSAGRHNIIAKRSGPVDAGDGWHVRFLDKNLYPNSTITGQFSHSSPGIDSDWQTFTLVFKSGRFPSNERYSDTLYYYHNGNLHTWKRGDNGSNTGDGTKVMYNDCPLTIGVRRLLTPGQNEDGPRRSMFVTNVQFYDVALPADFIKKNYNKTGLDKIPNYPYWDNLIGYWPGDREEDFGMPVLKDYSKYGSVNGGVNAGRSDMDIIGNTQWYVGSSQTPNMLPVPDATRYRTVLSTIDLPLQIMQWIGVAPDLTWKLDGTSRPLNYKNLQ